MNHVDEALYREICDIRDPGAHVSNYGAVWRYAERTKASHVTFEEEERAAERAAAAQFPPSGPNGGARRSGVSSRLVRVEDKVLPGNHAANSSSSPTTSHRRKNWGLKKPTTTSPERSATASLPALKLRNPRGAGCPGPFAGGGAGWFGQMELRNQRQQQPASSSPDPRWSSHSGAFFKQTLDMTGDVEGSGRVLVGALGPGHAKDLDRLCIGLHRSAVGNVLSRTEFCRLQSGTTSLLAKRPSASGSSARPAN